MGFHYRSVISNLSGHLHDHEKPRAIARERAQARGRVWAATLIVLGTLAIVPWAIAALPVVSRLHAAAPGAGAQETDTDDDNMPDGWEIFFGLNPNSGADATGDPDGDGLSNAQEYARRRHPFGRHARYFAEGSAGGFFDTSLAILNPSTTEPAHVALALLNESGDVVSHQLLLGPRQRETISLDTIPGVAGAVSIIVESDVPVAADRAMTWGTSGLGMSLDSGSPGPATTWYFAEGATGPFLLYYLFQNPGPTAAKISIRYLIEGASPVTTTHTLAPYSRTTVFVNDDDPALSNTSLGAVISSDVPILAERAMYTQNAGALGGGAASSGSNQLSTAWFFGEGATGPFFNAFLSMVNPGGVAASATVTYHMSDGSTASRAYDVPAEGRRTVYLNAEAATDAALAPLAFGPVWFTVVSTQPILGERAMWWSTWPWYEGHAAPGSVAAGSSWAVPEGRHGGPDLQQTYVLVGNASATTAGQVRVTLIADSGPPATRDFAIGAGERLTLDIGDVFTLTNTRFSVIVDSVGATPVPLIVDYARYRSVNGVPFSGGGAAPAVAITGDEAPNISSSTPASAATGVAVDANLSVTFSEPVSAAPGAFVLECPSGTPIALTNLTVSPATTFTLDPAADLPFDTTCLLRINAAAVTDVDTVDPPDTIAADVAVPFTTMPGPNEEPSFTVGPDVAVAEDPGPQSIASWATNISPGAPPHEAAQIVTFSITGNTNAALFAVAPAVASNGTLTFTPAPNAIGTATITLVAQDNGGTAIGGDDTSAPQHFTITVTSVNDAPTFTAGGSAGSAEDAGPQSMSNWATAISPGPADEAGQTLTFDITGNTNPALFSAGPSVAPDGSLTYTSAPGAFGTADITVVLHDNGGTANGGVDTSAPHVFTILVTSVNDGPNLTNATIAYGTAGNTQLHVAGATLAGVTNAADASGILTKSAPTDSDGPSPLTVVPFTGATANGSIAINADGTFTYVPNAGFTGLDSVGFQVTDGVTSVAGTMNITVSSRVWYVRDTVDGNNPAGGDGRSTDAFETLAAAEAASLPNDIIFVFEGNTGTTPLSEGIALKNGQKLYGEGIGLTLGSFGTLVPAGAQPRISTTGAAVTVLANTANGHRTGIEIRGLNLASGTDNAIDVTSANAASLGVLIGNNTVSSAGLEGIDINQGSTGAATLAVHDNVITAFGTGLDMTRTNGTMTITAFDDNAITGETVGSGIVINGPVTFDSTPGGTLDVVSGGATQVGHPGNGVGGSGFVMTSATGHLHFDDFELHADNGAALSVQGTGAFTGVSGLFLETDAGAPVFIATSGPAVALDALIAGMPLVMLSSTNSATNGVSLVNVGGTFTAISSSTISNAGGTDFSISGGTATVTYEGTIVDDVGMLVSVTGATSGPKSFTGAITDGNDGDGSGISLTGNTGATVTFSGGLTLSTGANDAFTATGGGFVNVCDETPCDPAATGSVVNRITTTTGTALNVANTAIGPGQLEFRSISANFAANGIVLANTGFSGGLKVKGTGAANSGGTIRNTAGDGIVATNTQDLSLTSMLIQNPAGYGINATNLRGVSALTNSTISGFDTSTDLKDGLRLVNDSVNLTSLTISGSTFSAGGYHGVSVEARGTSNMTITVSGSTFTGLYGDGVNVNTLSGASGLLNVSILNSNFVNAGAGQNGGISLNPFNGPMVFNATITGNTLDNILKSMGSDGHIDITVGDLDAGGGLTSSFNISGNTIRNNSTDHRGISIVADWFAGITDVRIENNDIDNLNRGGIFIDARDSVADLDVVVNNNRIGQLSGSVGNVSTDADEAVYVSARDNAVIDLLFTNNTITSNGGYESVWLRAVGNATLNATVNDNTIIDNGGVLEVELAFSTPTTDGGTVNASATGNQLGSGGILQLSEGAAGTGSINVTQASAAALAAANNGATVTQTGAPAFGAPPPPTPIVP